jgi:hypothetical protein
MKRAIPCWLIVGATRQDIESFHQALEDAFRPRARVRAAANSIDLEQGFPPPEQTVDYRRAKPVSIPEAEAIATARG